MIKLHITASKNAVRFRINQVTRKGLRHILTKLLADR